MKAIPETLKEELAREFTQEQIEEGYKRLEWIIRVRDRGEDNQTVLNELGIERSPNGLTASQLKIPFEAEFERQFSLSKTKELLQELRTSRQAGSPEKKLQK